MTISSSDRKFSVGLGDRTDGPRNEARSLLSAITGFLGKRGEFGILEEPPTRVNGSLDKEDRRGGVSACSESRGGIKLLALPIRGDPTPPFLSLANVGEEEPSEDEEDEDDRCSGEWDDISVSSW